MTLILAMLMACPAYAQPQALSASVEAAGLQIQRADFIVSDKGSYLHLLWDAFPVKKALAEEAKAKGLAPGALRRNVVKGLLESVSGSYSKALKAKVDVVEFTQRDEYGLPRWSSVHKLAHFEIKLGKNRLD